MDGSWMDHIHWLTLLHALAIVVAVVAMLGFAVWVIFTVARTVLAQYEIGLGAMLADNQKIRAFVFASVMRLFAALFLVVAVIVGLVWIAMIVKGITPIVTSAFAMA